MLGLRLIVLGLIWADVALAFGVTGQTPRPTPRLPDAVTLRRALSGTTSRGVTADLTELARCSLRCGLNPLDLLQPSPFVVVAEDAGGAAVGYAQLARIGSGYLYLTKDFELKNVGVVAGGTGEVSEYDGVPEACIAAVLDDVPEGNTVWAVVPAAAAAPTGAHASQGFEQVSLATAFQALWPSALFFGSPLFLLSLLAASAVFVLPLLPVVAVALGEENARRVVEVAAAVPPVAVAVAPPVVLAASVGAAVAGKVVLRAVGRG